MPPRLGIKFNIRIQVYLKKSFRLGYVRIVSVTIYFLEIFLSVSPYIMRNSIG